MKKLTKELLPKKMGDIVEENVAKLLDEGYFKSYPTETTKRAIEKILKNHRLNMHLILQLI